MPRAEGEPHRRELPLRGVTGILRVSMGQRAKKESALPHHLHMPLPDTSRAARVGKGGMFIPAFTLTLKLWLLLRFT